ncbi:MAG: ABC transporter substrate-binding protein [Synergistaceae bacterium]|jgi:peptide/nickel transport system substrate-binding protein|nr:ABC transporter substrate-binding protein [Synergistaceae bacterium]
MKKKTFGIVSLMFAFAVFFSPGAAVAADAVKKDLLRVVVASEAKGLDPMLGSTDRPSAAIYCNIYETLLKINEKNEIVPGLAVSYEQIDDVTYEFKLKKGVKFHDGGDFTAKDVVFTMTRGANTPITQYIWGIVDTSGFEIIDDHTVRVRLKEPNSPFIAVITCSTAAILSEKYVTEAGDASGTHPIGTGPYRFVEWKKGVQITLERNEDYHGTKPQAGKIVVRTIPEASNRTIELESGGCDIAMDIQAADRARIEDTPGLRLVVKPGNAIRYVGFNTSKAPYDKVEIRRAISHAIDIEGIVESVLRGYGEVTKGPISPNVMFYDNDAKMISYDAEKAKRMLGDAGFPQGFRTTIWCDERKENVDIATILQAQLAEIGITADINVQEFGAYINSAYAGDTDIYIMGWSSASPDPDIVLYSVFYSGNKGEGGNCSFLDDPKVDGLIERGRRTFDTTERTKIYKELQEYLLEIVPWVYLWVDSVNAGVTDEIDSISLSGVSHHPLYTVTFK